MKIHKLPIAIAGLSVFWIILVSVRYYWLYPDTSQLIMGDAIGAIALAGAYTYNWMKDVDERFNTFEKRLDAFSKWFMKNKVLGEE